MNVFVDTNVLLDVLMERQPFAADSKRIWFLAETGRIKAHVSAISFNNIYYIVRKMRGTQAAVAVMRMLRDTFAVVACDERVILQSIDARFEDFEDAIQFFSALHCRASCLVTRNPDHFPPSDPPALSPAEFLATHLFD